MITEVNGCALEICDGTNPWIDCVFIVDEKDKEKAKDVLQKAYEDFWKDDVEECYGDFFKRRMDEAGIAYELFYGEREEDEDE